VSQWETKVASVVRALAGRIKRAVLGARASGPPRTSTVQTGRGELETLLGRVHPMATEPDLIRLGGPGDGGYLVPDDLAGITACVSPGVGHTAEFELDCARRGMKVFLADASVDGPPVDDPQFSFTPTFIGPADSAGTMTLASWLDLCDPPPGDMLLQMDIEGAEYGALLATSDDVLERFRVIVVEFHDLHLLASRPWFALVAPVFERLCTTHVCVHIHPNNCCPTCDVVGFTLPPVAEFTFWRRDRARLAGPATTFPHRLDADNVAHHAHLVLPSALHA
jgi:hypothetical protein